MTKTYDIHSQDAYYWTDFEPEPDTTGDGSGDPEKYFLTICDPEGESFAYIIHRICGGRFPIDGEIANQKRADADLIVFALNAHGLTLRTE